MWLIEWSCDIPEGESTEQYSDDDERTPEVKKEKEPCRSPEAQH